LPERGIFRPLKVVDGANVPVKFCLRHLGEFNYDAIPIGKNHMDEVIEEKNKTKHRRHLIFDH
jgi:hypothetical protein